MLFKQCCTSAYETVVQNDALRQIIEYAIELGVNIFSFEYIDKNMYPDLYTRAREKGLKIRHPIIGEVEYANSQLYREMYGHLGNETPVVGVFGTGKSQGKFTTQIILRKLFMSYGYNVCNFGTETHCELFGFEGVCPLEMDSSIRFPRQQILRYIQGEMRRIEIEKKPDLIIVGGQSGVVPYTYNLKDDEYTLPTLTFLMATVPHIYILCINVWDDIEYIRDTINVLESLGKGKVIALVASKISKTVINEFGFVKKRTLTAEEFVVVADNMYSNFLLPLYDIMNPMDASALLSNIIHYFDKLDYQ